MPTPGDEDRRTAEDYSLFVTNLPIELNEDGIEKIFKQYGKIKGIIVRSEGQFAFISYGTYAEAENAISSLDGKPPLNLKVQFRKKSADTPRDEGERSSVNYHPLNDIVASRCELSPPITMQRPDYLQKDVQLIDSSASVSRIDFLRARMPPQRYHNDLNSPGVPSQHMYSPYDEIEYAETNALWLRGSITTDAAGRRHVTMGRGHICYHIPEPQPRIKENIGKVYEKRHARYYEYGSDQCKQYMGKCIYCSQNATLCCSFCDGFYCSRNCQIDDWPKHQGLCKNIPPLVNANDSREFFKGNNATVSEVSSPLSQVSPRTPRISSTPAFQPHGEIIREKQQKVLRRPKEIIIDQNENIKSTVAVNEKTEVATPSTTEQKSAVSSAPSTIQEHGQGKTINDDAFAFKRIDKINEDAAKSFLSSQKFIDVQIIAEKEPGQFFIQKIEDFDKITQLTEEINEKFTTYNTVEAPIIGRIYGVIYEEIWHRGRVVSLNPLTIDYLDYGLIAEVKGQMNVKDIGSLAEIPRFSRLIKVSEKVVKSRKLVPDSAISVKMIDVAIDAIDGDEIINVEVAEEAHTIPDHTEVIHNNNNNNEIKSPPSILNFMTFGMTAVAEICDKIDDNTARIVLNFDSVKDMFESLVDPLASDCEEISSNYENYVPIIHEFVSIKKPDDAFWYRGCVLKITANENNSIDTIEIASLDEGIIINHVDKIIPLITKYNDVCIFSATMKSKSTELKTVFEPGNVVQLQITSIDSSDTKNSINHVKAALSSANGVTAEVLLYQWTPWRSDVPGKTAVPEKIHSKEAINHQQVVQSSPALEKTSSINKKKSIDRFELKNNTKVVIQSYRSPSVVFLRSFEADEIERNNQLIQNVAKSALISSCLKALPEIGDYVLSQYVDDNFYRAMVLTVEHEDKKIKIVYIDYGNMEVTTLDKLRVMPESLMNEPCCTRKVMLKGIKSVPSTKEAMDYLAVLVATEEQLICELDDSLDKGCHVVLKSLSGSSINEKINKLLTPSWEKGNNHVNEATSNSVNSEAEKKEETITNSVVLLSETPTPLEMKSFSLGDIELGNFGKIGETISALFLDTIEPGVKYVFALVDTEMIVHITTVMPEMMKKYCESMDYYIPRDNELCIALYEDNNWYRGCCFKSRASANSAMIYFLDFGNIAEVLHENIRMMSTDFLRPGTFGCVCTVNEFSDPSKVLSPQISLRLESLLVPNETYKVEIVGFDGEEYVIKLPEIHSKLVEEGLLSP